MDIWYLDVALNAQLLEAALQDLKVVYELVVVLGFPVDLVQGDFAGVDHV